jgi:hypothetical protein
MTGTDNFESVVRERREETVAEFHERLTPLRRFQHALHSAPSLVPLIVLLGSVLLFAGLVGTRFFSAATLTLILQQVQLVGIVAVAQTLVILTAGIDLSVGAIAVVSSVIMGQFAFRYGIPAPLAVPCGLAWARPGLRQRLARGGDEAAALHRDAGDVAGDPGLQLPLQPQRDDPRAGHHGRGADPPVLRPNLQDRRDVTGAAGATFTYGVIFMLL